MLQKIRNTVGPLSLMVLCPPFVILMWYTNTSLHGSLSELWNIINQQGFFNTLYDVWAPIFFGTRTAWFIIFSFILLQLILMKIVPGKIAYGTVTPKGNIPTYKSNGLPAFAITIGLYCFASFYLNLFSPTIIYDNFGAMLSALNILSYGVCLFLYLKGRYAPSTSDSGLTGNFIFDFYWGTELYPYFAGYNLKMFINCRLGMMSWGVIVISCAAKQLAVYGFLSNAMLVSAALQLLYVAKFFFWETGYLRSLDIMHDRAGFYICWGCLVWVPGIYTSPALYLVAHPIELPFWLAFAFYVLGVASIIINNLADKQRQLVRETQGNCKVWGKEPHLIKAIYIADNGEKRESLLLTSGWWGVARHFHYIPEITGAFFWTVPALFTHITPYFYVVFLTILLMHRAYRDDERCAQKYGKYWDDYCNLVPYKVVPFVI